RARGRRSSSVALDVQEVERPVALLHAQGGQRAALRTEPPHTGSRQRIESGSMRLATQGAPALRKEGALAQVQSKFTVRAPVHVSSKFPLEADGEGLHLSAIDHHPKANGSPLLGGLGEDALHGAPRYGRPPPPSSRAWPMRAQEPGAVIDRRRSSLHYRNRFLASPEKTSGR